MKSYLGQNYKNLSEIAEKNAQTYLENKPFPHIVFDNFFDENLINDIKNDFPLDLNKTGHTHENEREKKLALDKYDKLSKNAQFLINQLNSYEFISFLNKISGIEEPLIPDPYLEGGGYHELKDGGFLNVHTDFNLHRKMNLDRRLNVLIYLNEDWKEEFGGSLELWDKDMKNCVKKIVPNLNKIVIFNTNDFSYHGNPEKINHPNKISRKSIALYYYSNGRPKTELRNDVFQSTVFMKRPGTKDRASSQFKKIFGKFYLRTKI